MESHPQPSLRAQGAIHRRLIPGIIAGMMLLHTALPNLSAQQKDGRQLVVARLQSSMDAVVPGKPLLVALEMAMAPGWHSYWSFAGDAGLATKIEWELPPGFSAGPIQWPTPEAILTDGDILNYGYEGTIGLLVEISTPTNLPTDGAPLRFQASASWLVCEKVCVPGSGEFTLELPVAPTANATNKEQFEAWRAALPRPFTESGLRVTKVVEANMVIWKFSKKSGGGPMEPLSLYPLPPEEAVIGHPGVKANGDVVEVSLPVRSAPGGVDALGGVIRLGDGHGAASYALPSLGEIAVAVAAVTTPEKRGESGGGGGGLPALLFGGLIGGFILNFMPCVFPVLSLKIYTFIRHADQKRGAVLGMGIAFAAGIFTWCLGLAALITAAKAAGGDPALSEHFQNPWFILFLATVLVAMALNLFGVFEILPSVASGGIVDRTTAMGGLAGAYFQGLFATILGMACLAPGFGSAVAFAISQPAPVTFGMFGAIALGMSLPYLVLSAFPGWMKWLPRPGAWMEHFKKLFGFCLLAVIPWLLYVLALQKGAEGVAWASAFLVGVAMAAWIFGTWCTPTASRRSARTGGLLCAGVMAASGWLFLAGPFRDAAPDGVQTSGGHGGISWEKFSEAKLAEARRSGKPVFLDFTAAWCVSCKVNERFAIEIPAVQKRMEELGVIAIKADWTRPDPEISRALKGYGAAGVPLYVVYPPGEASKAELLPEILTPQIVLSALDRAKGSSPASVPTDGERAAK